MNSALLGLLLLLTSLPRLSSPIEQLRLERDFNEPVSFVTIENLDGAVEAQTWTAQSVRVIATMNGDGAAAQLESEVSIERQNQAGLKITAKPRSSGHPINLVVYVPPSARLHIKGGKEAVAIKGAALALSAETQAGPITFFAPSDLSADISLLTIQGTIKSNIQITQFVQIDSNSLNGKIAQGGTPIILKSVSGRITLSRDDDARMAALSNAIRNNPVAPNQSTIADNQAVNANLHPASFDGKLPEAAGTAKTVATPVSGEDVIKLEARLVNLNVKVVDSMGRPLPTLKKEEFTILEDNAQQDVYYFEPVNSPLNILLLLDLSGSTDSKMKVIKKAAKKFVESLNKTDVVGVAAFTRRFFVISNFTTDHELVKDRIGDIKNRHSGTAYYDAMWATIDMLDEVKNARKAIVVMTDGVDNWLDHPDDSDFRPKHDFDELIARIQEADVSIYPIYLDTEYEVIGKNGRNGHDAYITARKQLQEIAEQTGTQMFKAERAEDLENVYREVAAELHSLYSIGYTPKQLQKDGQWRKISVKVNHEGARARTKKGYFSK